LFDTEPRVCRQVKKVVGLDEKRHRGRSLTVPILQGHGMADKQERRGEGRRGGGAAVVKPGVKEEKTSTDQLKRKRREECEEIFPPVIYGNGRSGQWSSKGNVVSRGGKEERSESWKPEIQTRTASGLL